MLRNEWKPKIRIIIFILLIVFQVTTGYNPLSFAEENDSSVLQKIKISEDKRFIDRGDKTILDTETGLMWMKEDSFLHTGHWKSWHQAFEYVRWLNKEGFANYHDWEVPTVKELKTLYESEKVNSSQVGREMVIHIDPIFAKKGSGSSWSAQSNGAFQAFGVVFSDGNSFSLPKKSKGRKAVRAVRHSLPGY